MRNSADCQTIEIPAWWERDQMLLASVIFLIFFFLLIAQVQILTAIVTMKMLNQAVYPYLELTMKSMPIPSTMKPKTRLKPPKTSLATENTWPGL